MKRPKVSVVVTTKNEEKTIGRFLKSVRNQNYPNIEIVVVDNPKTTDQTSKIAREYTSLVYKKGPERSRQRNYGVQKANGEYVMVLDADMELSAKVVADCVNVVAKNPAIKAVIIPEKTTGKGFWSHCKALERDCYVGDEKVEAARFFERKTFLDFGGYDEKISGPEDWDLPQRIRKKYRPGRVDSSIIHNEEEISFGRLMKKKFYYAQSFTNYARKHPRIATGQALLIFRPSLYKNWRRFWCQPVVALGMFFMLGSEMVAGFCGAIIGFLKNKWS